MLNFLSSLKKNTSENAIFDEGENGQRRTISYQQLEESSTKIASGLLKKLEASDLKERAVPFLCNPNSDYLKVLIGVWKAGGVTTPLCPAHPKEEIKYFCEAVRAQSIVYDSSNREKTIAVAEELSIDAIDVVELSQTNTAVLPKIDETRAANILFTSGTTNRPKAVVTTHAALENQIQILVEAWRRQDSDKIANVLPLHHTHGLINVVLCSLAVNAELHLYNGFNVEEFYQLVCDSKINVFMAVPTIYSKLIEFHEAQTVQRQKLFSENLTQFRLMVSGSAALPVPVFKKWKTISSHALLERYGMTEIGMALSNPIDGERRPGTVGQPLTGVKTRIVDEAGQDAAEGAEGELLIQSPSLFREYLRNQKATEEAFIDGWFKTGDIVKIEDNYFKILGRSSMDIIKSGGYKISALEIESVLKELESIKEIAVVGLPDEKWGEVITACCVFCEKTEPPTLEDLAKHCKERLASYKVPRKLFALKSLPRNTMGKIQKKLLVKEITENKIQKKD